MTLMSSQCFNNLNDTLKNKQIIYLFIYISEMRDKALLPVNNTRLKRFVVKIRSDAFYYSYTYIFISLFLTGV